MKNINTSQLKTCIVMSFNEFEKLVRSLTNNLSTIEDDNDICDVLSKYFDIHVTSIHQDDCETHDIWICYE